MNRQPIITRESFASYGRSRGRKKRSKEYDLTPGSDGIGRMIVQVEFRLSLYGLSYAITCRIQNKEEILDWIVSKERNRDVLASCISTVVRSRRVAVELARDTLHRDGSEIYFYRVDDDRCDGLKSIQEVVLSHLEQLWKE